MSDALLNFDISLLESLLESLVSILAVLGTVLKGLAVCYGLYEAARRVAMGFVCRALARRKGHRFSPLWGMAFPLVALIYAAGLPLEEGLRRAELHQALQGARPAPARAPVPQGQVVLQQAPQPPRRAPQTPGTAAPQGYAAPRPQGHAAPNAPRPQGHAAPRAPQAPGTAATRPPVRRG